MTQGTGALKTATARFVGGGAKKRQHGKKKTPPHKGIHTLGLEKKWMGKGGGYEEERWPPTEAQFSKNGKVRRR